MILFIALVYCLKKLLHRVGISIWKFRIQISPPCMIFEGVRCQRRLATGTSSVSIASIRIQLHLPRRAYPRWLSFTAAKFEEKGPSYHLFAEAIHATLWIFPYLLRFTGGPWANVNLDDFRLRVYTSQVMPGWVAELRSDLITSILSGEYLRLDDLKTGIFFGDEWKISASVHNWHIRNFQNRIYSLVKLDAQLLRNWTDDTGKFVMIAEECRWTKVRSFEKRGDSLLWQMVYFPSDIWKFIGDPMGFIDIYSPRADITFDNFRIRDSELFKELGAKAREMYEQYY
ncbi:hypothetical protein BDN71DRAFT_1452021 [Pleurotus eryngii]|uniref:Uncharacterized protein n=1 Tax=Pleurotus eryngii TaxID=5323 RepID=A0A9P6DCU1_PLEER|nr:hypothetical protein BDN71DRAFT_1452021 [Pleurotus eryngii]